MTGHGLLPRKSKYQIRQQAKGFTVIKRKSKKKKQNTYLMTPEEFLMPRFKVIADYPHSDMKVGQVIHTSIEATDYWKKFPHLLKKLPAVKTETKEIHILKDGHLERLEKCLGKAGEVVAEIHSLMKQANVGSIIKVTGSLITPPAIDEVKRIMRNVPVIRSYPTALADGSSIGKCERKLLIVLAERNGKNSNKNQLGILSGYSPSSGGFHNAISKLRQLGYLDGSGDALRITKEGMDAVGEYTPLPKGKALHQYWINKLPKCEGVILQYLIECEPAAKSKEDIGTATEYSHSSGGFNNALSKLRTLELVEGFKEIKASNSLFE